MCHRVTSGGLHLEGWYVCMSVCACLCVCLYVMQEDGNGLSILWHRRYGLVSYCCYNKLATNLVTWKKTHIIFNSVDQKSDASFT